LILNLNSLGQEPGEILLQSRGEDSPELLELGCGGPLTGLAKVVSTPTHFYVDLVVRGSISLECGRCLDKLTSVFEVRPKLLVEKKEAKGLEWVEHDGQGVEDYLVRVGLDVVDIALDHLIAEQIILNYNLNPLPTLDDKDLCMQCGKQPPKPEAFKGKRLDPRWEKLRSLKPYAGPRKNVG
jgi:uncharacterized protein